MTAQDIMRAAILAETRTALRDTGGNRTRAAKALNLSKQALYGRLEMFPELVREFPATQGRPEKRGSET